jgi:23S rRNA (adenine2503-C2)-methyltransferase
MASSIGIKQYGIEGIKSLMASWGEPAFRANQLIKWLYEKRAADYDAMSNLSVALRDRLKAEEPLVIPKVLNKQVSRDGTRKYLMQLADGCSVEVVGIPDKNSGRLTVCFSTQVGCGMGCLFCATGTRGLTRSLWPGEMADQLIVVSQDMEMRVTNAVAMGEGEPFASYTNTLEALQIMNSPNGLGIGARHLTVSTCGLLKQIAAFAREAQQFTLAVSLHSAVQPTRGMLMPAFADQSLEDLRLALIDYASVSGRRPSLEVTLIQGINDTDSEVNALVSFAQGLLCHVNLIALNSHRQKPVPASRVQDGSEGDLRGDTDAGLQDTSLASDSRLHATRMAKTATFIPSSPRRCKEIADILTAAGIECSVRRSRGADIDAACGQLKGSLE